MLTPTLDLLFAPYAADWLAHRGRRIRRGTYENYADTLRRDLIPILGDVAIGSITRRLLLEVVHLLESRGLAPSTIRTIIAIVHTMFADLVEREIFAKNPADGVSRAIHRGPRREPPVFTEHQLGAFLAAARVRYPRYFPVWLACAHAGLRVGESRALRAEHVDLDARHLRIQDSVSVDGVMGLTKSGQTRIVDMSAALVTTLGALRRNGFLTTGRYADVPVSYATIRQCMQAVTKTVGLPRRSPHALRHTYASLLVSKGVSLEYVRRQLGHASITITIDLYGRWLPMDRPALLDQMP